MATKPKNQAPPPDDEEDEDKDAANEGSVKNSGIVGRILGPVLALPRLLNPLAFLKLSLMMKLIAGGGTLAAMLFIGGAYYFLAGSTVESPEGASAEIVKTEPRNLPSERAAFFDIPDIIVNCAGVARAADFIDTKEADWDLTMNVNLKGVWLVGRQAASLLVKNKKPGSIINIASLLGLGGVQPQLSFYQTSKTGVVALTRSMATELFRYGIRVNALCPGYVMTDMNREFFTSEEGRNYIKRMPQRRLGEKSELKGPLLLLASDAGSFINGAALPVDGGHSIRVI